MSAGKTGWRHLEPIRSRRVPVSTRRESAPAAPLAGLVAVVTRPGAGEDEPLSRALAALGADVRAVPALVIEPPRRPAELERALARWSDYAWVVFTSPRGVAAVGEALAARGRPPGENPPRRLAVIGPTTAAAARAFGWEADLVPERFDGDSLLAALDRRAGPLADTTILLPVAESARTTLGAGLRARGAVVDQVVAYRSAPPADFDAARLDAVLASERPVLVVLASPSAARNLLELAGGAVLRFPAAAIGPVTGDAARRLGWSVVAQPEEHTLEALADAVVAWWTSR